MAYEYYLEDGDTDGDMTSVPSNEPTEDQSAGTENQPEEENEGGSENA